MSASIPEEAIVDAVLSDHLVAATLLVHLANRDSLSIRAGLLDDIARDQNITSQKLESILEALLDLSDHPKPANEYRLKTGQRE